MIMRVALFVPCLVDRFLPEIGIASVRLLQDAGVEVSYDPRQTCCGQPAFNAGYPDEAVRLARRMLQLFEAADVVVAPSGSCVAMVRDAYGDMDLGAADFPRWKRVRERIFELSEFLAKHDLTGRIRTRMRARAVVHYSCHHLRHINGRGPLDALLERVEGLEVQRVPDAVRCCGFGGVFSVKLPDLSIALARQRLEAMLGAKPDVIALADAGCVLHLRGVADRLGRHPPIVHYSQLLTGVGLESGDA